jgi:hypothetical protein
LYELLFPEDQELIELWHHAGADVEMLIRVIDAYFTRANGLALPGRIENYLLSASSTISTATEPVSAAMRSPSPRNLAAEDVNLQDDEIATILDEDEDGKLKGESWKSDLESDVESNIGDELASDLEIDIDFEGDSNSDSGLSN